MKSIDGLLNTIKQRHNISSDYKLALFLGIGEGNIANYRKKRSMPNAMACEKIAKALDMDPDVLTVHFEALRSKDDETRAVWERIASRLQSGTLHSVLFALLVVMGFITTPPSAHAAVTDLSPKTGLYIMYS